MANQQDQSQQDDSDDDGGDDSVTPINDKKVKLDLQIACGLVELALFGKDGLPQLVNNMQKSKDPAQVLATILFTAIFKSDDAMKKRGMQLDERIWTSNGGVLDRVLFDAMGILNSLGFKQTEDPHFTAAVKAGVLGLMHGNSHGQDQMNQQQQSDPSQQQQQPPQQQQDQQQQPQQSVGGNQ